MLRFRGLVSAALLLAACSHAPEPIEPKHDRPARTTAPAPSATPPMMPAAAKRHDATGAANFVLYWVNAFNYGATTGDTAPMREYASHCKPCNEYADDFSKLRPSRLVRGKSWRITNVSVDTDPNGFHVNSSVHAIREPHPYPLTFVLKKASPYELLDVFERAP